MFFVATLPAVTIAPVPILTPGQIMALAPTQHPRSQVIGRRNRRMFDDDQS